MNDLIVARNQQIAKRLDAALLDQVANLLGTVKTARRCVRKRPASLLLRFEIAVLQNVDERRNEVGVDNGL